MKDESAVTRRSAGLATRAGRLPLVGGAPALDLANTASGRGSALHLDHLLEPLHLLDWACHARVAAPQALAAVRALLADDAAGAALLLARALALREAVHRAGGRLAAGDAAAVGDLEAIAGEHSRTLAAARLEARDGRHAWGWPSAARPLDQLLGPLALSAVTLLTGAEPSRLKQCPGTGCGWLFLDRSRNRSRRWCEMEVCGNRAKSRRHRARHG